MDGTGMGRTVSIGAQGFAQIREEDYFLVDKTDFIRQWWENGDAVTLVCRPRRFGKTLTLSMVECFLSTGYAGRGEELFGGLAIWELPEYRVLQGTVPVVSLSFAKVKERDLQGALSFVRRILRIAVREHGYLRESPALDDEDRAFLDSVRDDMPLDVAADCLGQLCRMLEKHWGVKPVVLLDEYDTPMQEAWIGGYWDGMARFVRSLFNATFKTNPSLGRALLTGVTRVSRESIFSDLNNLVVVTTSSNRYATCFGFTESETFDAMDEMGLTDRVGVKEMYDGFSFGNVADIYNPWSITNYLDSGELRAYWANTSENGLVARLVGTGGGELQHDFEAIMRREDVVRVIDDQVAFSDLEGDPAAVWALLVATGYVKVVDSEPVEFGKRLRTTIRYTNLESLACFDSMVRSWFRKSSRNYSGFVRALLKGDFEEANDWLCDLLVGVIGFFDGGAAGGGASAPENFYHGLVLGLLVELRGRYEVTSNRESGYGRYDVMLCPLNEEDPAFVMEFKVLDPRREGSLSDALDRAHEQLRARAYAAQLVERGIPPERVREVAFAFNGKEVLLG